MLKMLAAWAERVAHPPLLSLGPPPPPLAALQVFLHLSTFPVAQSKNLGIILDIFLILCLVHLFFLSVLLSKTYIKSDYFFAFMLIQAFLTPSLYYYV